MVPLTRPRVLATGALLLALGLFALLAPGVGSHVAAMAQRIDPAQPYLSLDEPHYLYGLVPLSLLGALAVVLGPGLMLALLVPRRRGELPSVERWLLEGFALSTLVLGGASSLAQGFAGEGETLRGAGFVALASGLTLGATLAAWWRAPDAAAARATDLARPWPVLTLGHALALVGVPLAFVALLAPKFFWESFNGDGAHAFEAARLLLVRPVPFWDPGSGDLASYPGMNSVLYLIPTAAFLRLYGGIEAAARLPYALFMLLLFAAIVASAREARPERLSRRAQALIWVGVVSFSLVMAYAATYDPYCADIALPATQDALLVACFLAMASAFEGRRPAWTALFAAFVLLCSPAGPVLIGGWLLGVLVCFRPLPRARLSLFVAAAGTTVVLMAVAPLLMERLGLPAPGGEHGAGNMLSKFERLIPDHFARLGWVLLPCGIYPFAVLAAWRRADEASRALLLVAGLVLGMYYLIAFVSLHYFVPAMVLPLAAFWRVHRLGDWRARRGPALAVCCSLALVSLLLGLPTSTAIYTATREVGRTIDASRVGGYEVMRAEAFASSGLLTELFVPGWTPTVPDEHYAGAPPAWYYYAHHRGPAAPTPVYELRPVDSLEPLPAEAVRVAADEHWQLVALDPARWAEHRTLSPPGSSWRSVYDVPRDILFGRRGASDRYTLIDVKGLLSKEDPR